MNGRTVTEVPARSDHYEAAKPVYETFPGWKSSIVGVDGFERLPDAAKAYVAALEKAIGAPITLLSTGPKREETIVRPGTVLDTWLSPARR